MVRIQSQQGIRTSEQCVAFDWHSITKNGIRFGNRTPSHDTEITGTSSWSGRKGYAVSGQRRRYDRLRDADGTHVAVGARVQQVEVHAGLGALRFRLHQRGEVIGRRTTRLVVRFDGQDQPVSIRPHLVQVISE